MITAAGDRKCSVALSGWIEPRILASGKDAVPIEGLNSQLWLCLKTAVLILPFGVTSCRSR